MRRRRRLGRGEIRNGAGPSVGNEPVGIVGQDEAIGDGRLR